MQTKKLQSNLVIVSEITLGRCKIEICKTIFFYVVRRKYRSWFGTTSCCLFYISRLKSIGPSILTIYENSMFLMEKESLNMIQSLI
jgi:hypothetical protein